MLRIRLFLLSHVMVYGDCFGQSFHATIGLLPVTIHTPDVVWADNVPQLKPWNTPYPLSGICSTPATAPIEVATWGEVHGWNHELRACDGAISSLLVTANDPSISTTTNNDGVLHAAQSEHLDNIISNAHYWIEHFRDWQGIYAKQYTGHPDQLANVYLCNRAWLWPESAHPKIRSYTDPCISLDSFPVEYLSRETLQTIISQTSLGNPPPHDAFLLSQARNALFQARYRQAVLDAATATEITLKTLLHNETRTLRPQLLKALRVSDLTLGKLVSIFDGTIIPCNTEAGLVQKRNLAIHIGQLITKEDAQTAVAIAEHIVSTASRTSSP